MRDLRVQCCTWNVGDSGPATDDLQTFLGLNQLDIPDIIGVALQEVLDSAEWRKRFIEFLHPAGFALVKSRNCWAIWIFLFVRRNLLSAITNIESEVTPSGYVGIMGNKGGVSVRFEICGVNVIFLSCHFTAHRERTRDRLNDYLDILDHQSFRDEDVHSILDHDYVFWMGDLNFRLQHLDKATVERFIDEKRFDELLEHDQLLVSMRNGLIFEDFIEGQITFAPTFKFDKGTNQYDTSAKQRVPAWTDRILFMAHRDFAMDCPLSFNNTSRHTPTRGAPSHAAANKRASMGPYQPKITLHRYVSLPEYMSSDHRPVVANFFVAVPPRWFSLPINFTEPVAKHHIVGKDLKFAYTILDPPNLLHMTDTDRILSTQPPAVSLDFIHFMLISTLGHLKTSKEGKTEVDSMPNAPSALEQHSSDWIGIYPSDIADLEEGYCDYVRAPKATKSLFSKFIFGDDSQTSGSEVYKGKVPAHCLAQLRGHSLKLVYWSRNKNCPQGYSHDILIRM